MLDCREIKISKLINVSSSTITFNKENTIAYTSTKRSGRRLIALFFVVDHYYCLALDKKVIMEILETRNGSYPSVLDMIRKDVADRELLFSIASSAYEKVKEKRRKENERFLDATLPLERKNE